MTRFSLILLLTLFAFSSAQNPFSCVDAKFQGCQYNLAQQIGLNDTVSSKLFKDYTIMYNYFLWMTGKNPGTTQDMLTVCNGLETFNLCNHGNQGCLDISNLIQKTDINNAYGVEATYRQYQRFNCGPGINTLIHEGLSCPQRVVSNYQLYLQTCVASYETSVANDQANGCTYAQTLMNCWSAPFQTASCGSENGIAVWWACEQNKVFAQTTFPSCPLSCDEKFGPFTGSHANYMDTHHKIENGVHFFKVSNHVEKVDGKLVEVEGVWMS
ncbi:unnamed protein product [Caenorhabditis angaria]|uniref:DUF19 domain-containing protein n=1 Tax=Caenorhabditis angaria TaxID=860376 RepID=A0A9P1IRC8_9PELO|nr:unnamed protein product [Caenorhabditis angaria]